MDRRRFLTGMGGVGIGGLSGCSAIDSTTPSSNSSSTSTSNSNESSPEILNLEYTLDDPESAVGNRSLRIQGEATIGTKGVIDLELSDGTAKTLEKENFETNIVIDGGQRYTLKATATDEVGSVTQILDLGYIPAPTSFVPDERLIGAHYYVWWGADWHWEEGYPGTPILGEYNARDPAVIDQHITWALDHGISWFNVSWWGRDSWSDVTLRDYFPQAERSDEIEISILYEPRATLKSSYDWRVDFDDPDNREQFIDEYAYLSETYFERDNYLYLDGKPVMYIYVAQGFFGDFAGTISEAVDVAGVEPYLIGDFTVVNGEPVYHDALSHFDAVNDYGSSYDDRPDVEERYPDDVIRDSRQWMLSIADTETAYIPDVGPGFDKSYHSDGKDLAVLDPSPEEFAEFCRKATRQFDPDLNAALITSFNEWYEGTVMEPAEEWGTRRLEIVNQYLAGVQETYENQDRYGTITVDFDSVIPEEELNPDANIFARDLSFCLFELTLLDGGGNEVQAYDIGGGEEPYFTEGAFGPEEHEGATWRWLGGPTGQSSIKILWDTLSPVRELRFRGNPPNHPEDVSAKVAIETLGSNDICFDKGRSEYSVTFSEP